MCVSLFACLRWHAHLDKTKRRSENRRKNSAATKKIQPVYLICNKYRNKNETQTTKVKQKFPTITDQEKNGSTKTKEQQRLAKKLWFEMRLHCWLQHQHNSAPFFPNYRLPAPLARTRFRSALTVRHFIGSVARCGTISKNWRVWNSNSFAHAS